MIRHTSFFLLAVILAALFLPVGSVHSASRPPAEAAGAIRDALFETQMLAASRPTDAEAGLTLARKTYSGEFTQAIQQADPQAHQRIISGLDSAVQSLAQADIAAIAAARAQVWTAILAGSYVVIEQAIQEQSPETARAWLPVREFRPVTRFSRPSVSATLAIDALEQGTMPPAEALLAVQADLYDTYQVRLTGVLHDLPAADEQGFGTRRAELAGLANGYFAILAPAYAQERGKSALLAAQAAFSDLHAAALAGQELSASLQRVDSALNHFRAAPLTPAEQARRAGQLLRYISLIPVEYNRGVKGIQLIHDFEIQEAITFHAGALAAFSDLESLLDQRDPGATTQARTRLEVIGRQLDQTARQVEITPAGSIQEQASALGELITGVMPAEWTQHTSTGDFDVIASMLDQMEAAIIGKDYPAAESARLEAYAIMEVGPEARLIAFAPQMKVELEDLFWNGQAPYEGLAYLIKNRAPHSEIKATRARLDETLNAAQVILNASAAPTAVAMNAGMIMFREGLEAVIILASLMSSMKRPEEYKYRRPMWLGVLGAIAATILTWVLAHDVLQSLARYGEKLEAVVSMVAIAVLLVIMNWFFHKIYWTEWIAGFHARKRQIVSGEAGLLLGLVTLGFTSVYREGFETVLFLQALVLESGVPVVLSGTLVALAVVCLIGFITFKLQVNLPYKKMLVVTGVLIGAVLLQMVGATVHIFQVVGWLPIHVIGQQSLPYWLGTWFGIYATWEGLVSQALAAAFVIGSYYLAEGLKPNRKPRKSEIFAFFSRRLSSLSRK